MIINKKNYKVTFLCFGCNKPLRYYLNFHPKNSLIKYERFVCYHCGHINKITSTQYECIKLRHKNENKNENIQKMKIDEVKNEDIKIRNSLPENINFSLEQVKNADYNQLSLESKEGEKYKQWVMSMKNGDEYKIPVCVMNAFKKMTEKGLKEIEIEKSGSGLMTKYTVSFMK